MVPGMNSLEEGNISLHSNTKFQPFQFRSALPTSIQSAIQYTESEIVAIEATLKFYEHVYIIYDLRALHIHVLFFRLIPLDPNLHYHPPDSTSPLW